MPSDATTPHDALTLDPNTVLVRAPSLVLTLCDDDTVEIEHEATTFDAPSVALSVLDVFEHPCTVRDALERLEARGREHFIEVTTTLILLVKAGILGPPGARPRGEAAARGFVRPAIHAVMLDDHRRTLGFCDALRAVVGPDDVVVDIGTGTGVLAVSAALAGARHVYAVESSGIADLAERVVAANGVSDRVTVVRGRSTRVTLPERATVLVTETIGNDPLDESILEIVADAHERLLAPGARVIPGALEIVGVSVDLPDEVIARNAFTPERIREWQKRYGLFLSPLVDHRLASSQSLGIKTAELEAWPMAAEPVRLARIDLAGSALETLDERATIRIERDVRRFAMALAFRATLAPGIVLSTVPGEVHALNAWRYGVWPAFDLPPLTRGDRVEIRYSYARNTTTLRFAVIGA